MEPSRIICGNGSDELLALLAHAFLRPGDEGIYSEYGFLEYPICIRAAGGVPVVAQEKDKTADVDAILAKVSPRTKIVFLANPNNPTGTYISFSEVKRLQAALPADCLLVIDAAYAEYVQRNDYAAGIELAATCENVVMTRTFSKIHGLANLRIGWAYGPADVIDALNRMRGPFNRQRSGVGRGGRQSFGRPAHIDKAIAHNARWLPWLSRGDLGAGNWGDSERWQFHSAALQGSPDRRGRRTSFLSARGFILRAVAAYGLPNCLRMTVGSEEANRGVVAALAEFMRGDDG